jgi:hypothetical protein
VNAGDADVVEPVDGASEILRGERRLLGDRTIRGAPRNDGDEPDPLRLDALDREKSPLLMVHGAGQGRGDLPEQRRVAARREKVRPPGGHVLRDLHDLGGGFPLAEDHLGKSPPDRTVVVHLRETEILEGKHLEAFERLGDAELPPRHPVKKPSEARFVHSLQAPL